MEVDHDIPKKVPVDGIEEKQRMSVLFRSWSGILDVFVFHPLSSRIQEDERGLCNTCFPT